MGYSSDYANAIARIYSDMGRSQAEAKLQSGAAWGNAIQQIGQTVAGIPGQIAQDKSIAQQMKIVEANLARLARQDQNDEWLRNAMNSSVVDGKIDETRLTENLTVLGAAELAPAALQTIRESEEALQRLKNAQQQGQLNQVELRKMALGFFLPSAQRIKESNFDPGVINGSLAMVGWLAGPEEEKALRERFAADPMVLPTMVEEVLRPQQAKPIEVGGVLLDPSQMGPDGPKVLFDSRKPEGPLSLEQQLANAVASRNGAEVSRLRKEMMLNAAATRAPQQGPSPSYQRIETVDEAGNPVIQFMTPEEVRKQGGVKTSPKTTAKASGPATVDAIMGEIEALSGRINTSDGGPMSNVKGALRRGAAAGNMDNDVSEYLALVEGFIPMVARAVGHSGVLTQQDVDSVRALFPRPGDNAQLSKNKMDRVKRIMQQMQSPGDAPGGLPRGAGPGGGGAPKPIADPLGIRK